MNAAMDDSMVSATESAKKAGDTLDAYLAAAMRAPTGQFLFHLDRASRIEHSSWMGSPIFPLRTQGSDVLARVVPRVWLVGEVDVLSVGDGRFLSAYARAVLGPRRINWSVFSGFKHERQKLPHSMRTLQPATVVRDPWHTRLAQGKEQPDAIIFMVEYGRSLTAQLIALVNHPVACPVFISAPSMSQALLLRAFMEEQGCVVSPVAIFESSDEETLSWRVGACWFRVEPRHLALVRPRVGKRELALLSTLVTLSTQLTDQGSLAQRRLLATVYGSLLRWESDGASQRAVMVTDHLAFSAETGACLIKDERGLPAELLDRRNERLPAELMERVPEWREPLDDDLRVDWLLWATEALKHMIEVTFAPHMVKATPMSQQQACAAPLSRASLLLRPVPAWGGPLPRNAPPAAPTADLPPVTVDAQSEPATAAQSEADALPEARDAVAVEAAPAEPSVEAVAHAPDLTERKGTGPFDVAMMAWEIGRPDGHDDAFSSARRAIVRWLESHGYSRIAYAGMSHCEDTRGEVTVESDGESAWTMRYDDRRTLPRGAFDRVELTLQRDASGASSLGMRVCQIRQVDHAAPPEHAVPRVIATLAQEVGLRAGGVAMRVDAMDIAADGDVARFLALLNCQERTVPVVAIRSASRRHPDRSLHRLARRLAGLAIVAFVGEKAAVTLASQIDPGRMVDANGIRLYPAQSAQSDASSWAYGGGELSPSLADAISAAVGSHSLVRVGSHAVPAYIDVRNAIASRRIAALEARAQHATLTAQQEREQQVALVDALRQSLASREQETADLKARVDALESEVVALRAERDAARNAARSMRYQQSLIWSRSDGDDQADAGERTYPDTWDDLEAWVECYGEGRIVVLPQAIKAARESAFIDIPFAYQVLDFLVRYYVPMRCRTVDDVGALQACEDEQRRLGIDVSGVGEATRDHRYEADYRRTFEGRRITLDMHVKRGVGFDPATVFRCYFWYDDAGRRVVIGHLPEHLTNRITHQG